MTGGPVAPRRDEPAPAPHPDGLPPDAPRRRSLRPGDVVPLAFVAVVVLGALLFGDSRFSSQSSPAPERIGGNAVASKGRFDGRVTDTNGNAVLLRGADGQEIWLRTSPGSVRSLLDRHASAKAPVQVYWVDYADEDPWGWLVGVDGAKGTILPEGATQPPASDPNQPPR